MEVIRGVVKIKKFFKSHDWDNVVACLGNFDGVHLGHQAVIKKTVAKAKSRGGKSILITFDPHPLKVLEPFNAPLSLTSLEHRIFLIDKLGIDAFLIINFTKSFSQISPKLFFEKILIDVIKVKDIFVGNNFGFGIGKTGDVFTLKDFCESHKVKMHLAKPVKRKQSMISSTRIRNFIELGDLKSAKALLGRPVSVFGTVIKGEKIGHDLGFPTANIDPHHEAIPPTGVYAVKVNVEKKSYFGALNIGVKPTISYVKKNPLENDSVIEVHILDFKKNIYGKNIDIEFIKKIRAEKQFHSLDELVKQIKKDETSIRKIVDRGKNRGMR